MSKVSYDKFNSSIFGIKMGNIEFEQDMNVKQVIKNANKEGYEHLAIRIETEYLNDCNNFLAEGFRLVDTLVTYKHEYEKSEFIKYTHSDDICISSFTLEDVNLISKIAYNSFFNDRYHNDPSLDNEKCNEYYENWVKNSCEGFADVVFVAKDRESNILGFVTGKIYNEEESALVLSAVTDLARGKGVYTALIYEVMKCFKGKCKMITTGTQVNTYSVQKAWNKLGFKIYESKYVLHKRL